MIFGVSKRFLAFFFLVAILFVVFPQIDLAVSAPFHSPSGWTSDLFLDFLYDIAPYFTAAFALACLLAAIVAFAAQKIAAKELRFFYPRRWIFLFLVLSYILGPGLVVNAIFKDHFGRARPSQIEQFGGEKQFSPPFVISDQCRKNCSFASGHATIGFYFVSLALVLSGNAAKAVFAFALLYGSLVGYARIAQGGHFLSDVIFSFVFVYLTAKILFYAMFDRLKLPRSS